MTYAEIVELYHKKSASKSYMLGFERYKAIWRVSMTWKEFKQFLREGTASSSHGGGKQIKIYIPVAKMEQYIRNGRAKRVCDASIFEENYKILKNRGDTFEKVIHDFLLHLEWHRNRTPFWEGPDCIYLKRNVQLKYQNGSVTDESTMIRHYAEFTA